MKDRLHLRYPIFCTALLASMICIISCKSEKELTNDNTKETSTDTTALIKDTSTLVATPIKVKIYRPKVFNDLIKTAYISIVDADQTHPVYRLNSNMPLALHFDFMSFDHPSYYVEFIHCDHNWKPSNISSQEYIDGNDYQEFSVGNPSFNTSQNYTHFDYTFPNESIQFLLGGNYYLLLFDSETEDTLLQLPFYILDNQTFIEASTVEPTIPKYKFTHQKINLKVDAKDYEINDPYQNLIVQIRQNNRMDEKVENVMPSMVMNNAFQFSKATAFHFGGGKEFKYIDIRSLQNLEARVRSSKYIGTKTKIVLDIDKIRSYKPNISLTDMNGNYVIFTKDAQDHQLQGDYATVTLRLKQNQEMAWEDIYIVGAFNNWQILPEYKMFFNIHDKQYECDLNLKQGYYNYEYVTVPKGKKSPVERGYIEGHSRDAENDYFIYVYTKPSGENYMNLIGLSRINSRN